MKTLTCFSVFVLAFFLGSFDKGSADDPAVGKLIILNFKAPPEKSNVVAIPKIGDMVQIYLLLTPKKNEIQLRTLKVAVTGDSVSVAPVQEIPVWTAPLQNNPQKGDGFGGRIETTKRNVSAFFVAVKNGPTNVKITPIGKDGKEWPAREWVLQVGPKEAKKLDSPAK